ncbi:ABC transporter permease [Stutzerimonas nosocomialis]|uniref:ABC transporter permease n=1 Tax=Stutzerimonas nosocomialis TaxID=1056496 RepID=A0A5R9QBZ0_9GAMM|nr:ABC transporter permease [Stutzerimonas nosocomialis]TLX59119.1 ABC transporter permease [Stutzerimonas nosocomialis]TLX62490.1 ABC transporter permease [Stutzerimonas nosocomialis]
MRHPLHGLSARQRLGAALIALLVLFALLEGLFNRTDPALQDLARSFAAPSLAEPLGTDQFGRSMLARMGAALRLSLLLSLLCVVTSASIGVALGVAAGWRQGWIDRLLSLLLNMVLALPGLVLILLFAGLAPGSLPMLYVAISLVLWVEYFRVTRAITRSVVGSAQMQASRMLGFGWFYCLRRHLWPALVGPVLTLAAFGAAGAILALAALGFVAVGLRPPTAELGLMMVELFPYYSDAPWVLAQPVLAVFVLVFGLNLLAGKDR